MYCYTLDFLKFVTLYLINMQINSILNDQRWLFFPKLWQQFIGYVTWFHLADLWAPTFCCCSKSICIVCMCFLSLPSQICAASRRSTRALFFMAQGRNGIPQTGTTRTIPAQISSSGSGMGWLQKGLLSLCEADNLSAYPEYKMILKSLNYTADFFFPYSA